ncbi:bifunctional hydroxymethylpyrimidine kinase/phosphomethylpyrimidine kinase [Leptothoe kymatousa]|uniref:Bifunctional hydroxymethylpyrimidine kinase/phosphomethylpyrimidine kinase n=1 Tax=Leptothoe kymatousa TAU-MAC 1615 TaxID=2364775 RepID=A0ABS5Y584_9CYAN|nr:bifunctional hydroxymethylpyrimidine kinase/phosphomethylpyrimidine kinase [Leptothoe kymatousa]MBT9312145.1 bifunctional hydroxymethylpyrimidine kinase/phosphomethylpyrimidine kinase [Leptothoe kymatousa TAU-MAC 1615]
MVAHTPPVALTIAGSDSGGGAGIQADLRTFSFHRVHGTSALTCVTAQNTQGVTRVDALEPAAVVAQIEAVVNDIGIQSLKTGMLLNQPIIEAVADALTQVANTRCVIDPVMVSRTGAQLIDDGAIETLRQRLIPLATVLTPNRYEAEILSGQSIHTLDDMETAAQAIHGLGAQAVVVKGGGFEGPLRGIDLWYDGTNVTKLVTTCVETNDTHGTGCTLSAAIAANLALGQSPLDATRRAKDYVTHALHHSLRIGQGQGPVGHFYPILE